MLRLRWPVLPTLLFWSGLALMPSPARAFSRDFGCLFEAGSAAISARCALIMAEAAAYWHRRRDGTDVPPMPGRPQPPCTLTIEVHGFAPDGGPPDGVRRLGLLRALAVSAALRARGVPDDALMPMGYGGTGLLVPDTPLDPQNRRAWLRLREDLC